ncbi:hypothetical protein ACN42_g8911 [Penicillium freii]|uniref:Cytochrome P450 n=1 Tax=Penicillium freii TaxID=48697 RepID=A0A117NLY5_PENFR|nr:hypothetical protein ACN42_g8911 [Penicillium freii]
MLHSLSTTDFTNLWSGSSWIILTIILFVSRWAFSKFNASDAEKGPRQVGHTIPFIGHALTMAKDKKTFFMNALKENKYQPFWILVAGRRHYIFSDLTDAGAIHKNENDISIRNIKSFLYTQVFGVSKPDADLIWDVNKEAYSVDRRWLLGREEQDKITSQYFRHVDHHMNGLTRRILQSDGKEISVDGLLTVVYLEGTSTIQTFYGDTTLRKHPQILEDMIYVVTKGFKPILFGVPRVLAPKPYAARDRIISAFAELAEELDQRDDVSGYFQERYTYINSRGVSRKAIGADMFRHLFASLLNSLPTTYLAVLHILQSEELIRAIRLELTTAGYNNISPEQRVEVLPEKTPLLRSVWFETLRMHNNLITLRNVERETNIATRPEWTLPKGAVVSVPAVLIHYNETLHPEPDVFQPTRFLDRSMGGKGENAGRTLKPFGGGSSYCPGRVFGEKQLMGFVAELVMRFDVELVEEEFAVPPVSDFDDLWKQPRSHWKLKQKVQN